MANMSIEFLGTGSAFVLGEENFQSNIIVAVEVNGETKRLLIDAGTSIAEALNMAEYKPQDIEAVLITHLHADHVGGVEYIAFKNYFEQFPFGVKKPILLGEGNMLDAGWNTTWKGGMKYLGDKTATLETYFEVNGLYEKEIYNFHGVEISIFETKHCEDFDGDFKSYGVKIVNDGLVMVVSGDCKWDPEGMKDLYEEADIIFHDCEIAEYPNSVHAQYNQLKTLPDEIRAKMALYHYSTKGGTIELPAAVEDGFIGFLERGSVIELEDVNV